MKPINLLAFVLTLSSLVLLLACAGSPPPTPIPPTVIPTLVPPTAVPPSPTAAPTNTAVAATGSADATDTVRAAFRKFAGVTVFRMTAEATTSPVLFQPKYDPQPGDDPNVVTVFKMEAAQENSNLDITINGFAASFIGVFAGFDPDEDTLRVVVANGIPYANGVMEGETEAKWYQFPENDTTVTGITPQDLLAPVSSVEFADNTFTAKGTQVVDGRNCGVFEGNRAAFEAVLLDMSQSAILNTEVFDASTVDAFTFTVVACDDGYVHRVTYTFDARTKADAAKKGSFRFDAQIKDFGETIVIQAPTGAIPATGAFSTSATDEPDATIVAGNFATIEGEWEGKVGEDDRPLQFTVADGKVTYFNINYSVSDGSGCSSSGAYGKSLDEGGEIAASEFEFVLTDSDDLKFTVKGKFTTDNAASGTLAIQGETFCGATDTSETWTAVHVSAPDAAPTEEATEEPTAEPTEEPTVEPTTATSGASASATVTAVFAALAKNDVNGALLYMDDDVVYNVAGTSGIGKASLQSYMNLAVAAGAQFQVSNVSDIGGIVTFTVTVSGVGAGTYSNSSAIVQDGKVSIFTIQ